MKPTALVLVATLLLELMVPGISHAKWLIADKKTELIAGSDDKDIVVMTRSKLDLSRLISGWYVHVVYTSDGVRNTIHGKTVAWEANLIKIQSVQKLWKYWRIARDDIELLVTYKDRKGAKSWLRTRPALLNLSESLLEIATGEDIDLEKLKAGSFAFVAYESPGGSRWMTGKISARKEDEVLVQSTPWKSSRIVYGQIEKLAVGQDRKSVDKWFKEQYPRVRLKARGISRTWITGSFVRSTTESIELFTPDGVRRLPLSSIDEFEVRVGRRNHIAFGAKMGIAVNLALPVLASIFLPLSGRGSRVPSMEKRPGLSYLTKVFLPIFLGSTFIGYSIKSDQWVEISPGRLNLGIVPMQNKGFRAALSYHF